MNDLVRRRVAVAGAVSALAGTLGYLAGRAYFHVIIGSHGPSIVLREQRINFHLALVIAGFIALAAGLLTAELARSIERIDAIERALMRAALPVLFVAMALVFAWP